MKILALILSIYVTALTAFPCDDNHAFESSSSVQLVLAEQNQDHSDDVDSCTPFCFCNCCQTLSQTSIFSSFQVNLEGFEISIPELVQNDTECTITFWRPPKA
jgi:hypothetical protein